MKKLLTILFFIVCIAANATTYFVDPTNGNDANNGLTSGNAWKTAAKINSFTFTDGDYLLLKGGDSLVGTVRIRQAIHISSYGTGNATISCFKKASLTLKSGHVYAATITDAASGLNTVFVDGTLRAKARYPNGETNWLTYNDATSTATVLNTSLTGTPNYTGFDIVVKDAQYIIDNRNVSNQSTGALTLNSSLTYTPNVGGNGFFFQNDSTLCDSAYEWSMQGNRFNIYLPTATDVYYSAYDTAIRLMHVRGVTIQNINIVGANKVIIQFDTSNANTVSYNNISSCGKNALSWQKSDSNYFTHNTVKNSLNNFALLRDTFNQHQSNICSYNYIRNNTWDSCGIYAGMGHSDNGNYIGLYWVGHYNHFDSNIIKHTGYHGMYVVGKFDSITYNYFDSTCLTKNDGAAIYTWIDGQGGGAVWPIDWDNGMYIGHCIAVHGIANTSGTNLTGPYAGAGSAAYYTDLNANNINIEYSTGAYCYGTVTSFGTKAYEDTIVHNTFFNANNGRCRDLLGTNTTTYSTLFNANIFYAGDSSYTAILDYYKGASIAGISADSNYYTGIGVNNLYTLANDVLSFSQYQAATGRDAHGGTNPSGARSRSAILIYNPTFSDSTISMGADTYIDVHGRLYFDRIRLQPFQSLVLFPSIHLFTKTNNFYVPN